LPYTYVHLGVRSKLLIYEAVACRLRMVDKFEVQVRLAASHGGSTEKVIVEAKDTVAALVAAALKLDAEGKNRWSLVSCVKVTS
jgi:alkylhydroperoxidase/carboxymuconolactone decarboxylase family protein YurZ